MDTGLTERDRQTIHTILSKYPDIKTVSIFGSRAKGNFKSGSDIDLVIMDGILKRTDLLHLKSDFDESNLPYLVDVVQYNAITHKDLKEHIDRVGKEFYVRKSSDS